MLHVDSSMPWPVTRPFIDWHDDAATAGGVHSITAPDGTVARSRAPLARGAIVGARVPQVSGMALGGRATNPGIETKDKDQHA
jgi:hypothetical protein